MSVITQEVKDKMNELRKHLPTEQSLVIPILHEILNTEGWISIQSMKEAADYLNLPVGKVQEVATFYTMFLLKKPGKHHIELCTNISCYLNGAEKVMKCAEKRLGIKAGETTSDGMFSLSEVECLASCGTGPVAAVHDTYYEDLNEEKMLQLINELSKKGAH